MVVLGGLSRISILPRILGFICFLSFVWGFKFGPDNLNFDDADRVLWATAFQVGGLVIAAVLCHLASRTGLPSTRRAWKCFSIACWLYCSGNAFVVACHFAGYDPGFPHFTEAAFFAMAVAFAIGMAKYGELPLRVGQTTFYNFLLVYCAISVACLFLLQSDIEGSVISEAGTIVAFLYPALWFSVLAFGVMALSIHNHDRRSFAYFLLLVAVLFESIADIIYAKELVSGSYSRGGWTELLWMTSISLVIWAVTDRLIVGRVADERTRSAETKSSKMALASLPGAAIFLFMFSAASSGAFGLHPVNVGFSMFLGLVFAAVAGLREHSIIDKLHSLRSEADDGKRRLSQVLESTSDSVIVLDHGGKVLFSNSQAKKIFGHSVNLWRGANLWDCPPDLAFPGKGRLTYAMQNSQSVEYEAPFHAAGVWLGVHAFPTPEGLSVFFRDISERRRARIEIENLALRDTLTELANRAAFRRSLDDRLATSESVAILILDLDHFKEINDTRGHPVGDEVLRVVAKRLSECVKDGLVARLGGDEFAIILTDVSEDDAGALAEKIISALSAPIDLNDTLLNIGTSIGIAVAGSATDADVLIRNADIALYEVKNSGRGGHAFFRKAMETLLLERNEMKQDLAIALEKNQFELHYQPLVNMATGRISSFEALLRWNHPVKGLQPPDAFIPLIEESGLIIPIGAWVMRTACRQAALWPSDISVAVNVSTRQFLDPALLNTIRSTLADTGLQPHRLEIEITESALLDDNGENLRTLENIRSLGIKIALDDFGTGYSALNYLQKFNFDKLKIDKSFVQSLYLKEKTETIVTAVIGLGRNLGMAITAEGVETMEQYQWLEGTCQYAQGHLISRPLPAKDVPPFLSNPPVFESHRLVEAAAV